MNQRNLLFLLCCLAAAGWLVYTTYQADAGTRNQESRFLPVDEHALAASESEGRIFRDNDALYWISFAREMAETGSWRIRHTHLDNPPEGRPVHWSQSVSWWLLLLGAIRNSFTHEGLPAAIEHAALWAGPVQYLLFLMITGYLLFRRIGLTLSAVWMLNLSAIPAVEWAFGPLRPDHHGLHLAFVTSSLLCLILGGLGWASTTPPAARAASFFRPLSLPDPKTARRYFIASGALGGLGFWTGATIQLFGIGIFAAGAIILVMLMPPHFAGREKGITYQPSVWRVWACTGAVIAIGFYALEYAPSFPGMRLEVNHPLHAISWLCAGEFLTRFTALRITGTPTLKKMAGLGLLLLGAVILPFLLLFGPPEWHAFRDPLMNRLHDSISEFKPFADHARGRLGTTVLMQLGVLPIFLFAPPLLAGEKRTSLYEWAALWMALLAAMTYAILTSMQIRWMNFFAVSGLLLAILSVSVLWRHEARKPRMAKWFYVLVCLLMLQGAHFLAARGRGIQRLHHPEYIDPSLANMIVQRQLAERLGTLNHEDAFRIVCDPGMTPRLRYYGNLPGVTSYYWENMDGLYAAADFLASPDMETARRIAVERGITHVLVPRQVDYFARKFHLIRHGAWAPGEVRASLIGRILTDLDRLPDWIRRDAQLEREIQPGYLLPNGRRTPPSVFVFVVEAE